MYAGIWSHTRPSVEAVLSLATADEAPQQTVPAKNRTWQVCSSQLPQRTLRQPGQPPGQALDLRVGQNAQGAHGDVQHALGAGVHVGLQAV